MAGFVLKNTLSDNGGVTRGICKMDENGNLTEVVETKNIVKTADGTGIPVADGRFIHRTTKAFQPSQRENRYFRFVQNRENTLLKTIIEAQASRIREQEENIHELSKMVAQLQSLKANLEETLEEFRRQFYGVKSEKTSSKSKDDSRL